MKTMEQRIRDLVTGIKSNEINYEDISSEDIPRLLEMLNWGNDNDRFIINKLCKILRDRGKTDLLSSN